MKNSRLITALVVVIVVIGLGGFVYYEYFDQGGNLNVKVMDAPMTGVSAVYLTFDEVAIHGTTSNWNYYNVTSKTIDILGLTTTNASLFASISLTAQKYTAIWLYVTHVTVVVGGVSHNFTMESNWAKVVGSFNVSAHSSTDIIIAFNLSQELNLVAQIFTPVVGSVSMQMG